MRPTSHGVVPRNSGGAQLNPSTPPWIDINAPSNVIANIIILFEERASDCYDILVIVMPLYMNFKQLLYSKWVNLPTICIQ